MMLGKDQAAEILASSPRHPAIQCPLVPSDSHISPVANLRPQLFASQVANESKKDFVASYSDTLLLAVRVDNLSSELAQQLDELKIPSGRVTRDAMAYATTIGTPADLAKSIAANARAAMTFSHITVRTRLIRSPHYVLPLRKRLGRGSLFSDRVSVGRARNNDIVLRASSVSKSHAWFQCAEDGSFFLVDARSKNTTNLNGVVVDPSTCVRVHPGDEIRFGMVEALLVSAEVLWDAVSGA